MTHYSLEFAANITYLCIEEIRERGLQERKIFRKSLPNNGLFIKVFNKNSCTREDLSCVNIHSVTTLMQAALWSTQERIISKKAWRTLNYETCTLSKLSAVLTRQCEQLLICILDFLVEVMQYKHINQMDAYKLGDALGKVVLGPSDCNPIMEEKAGHFMTRLIIEHAKILRQQAKAFAKKEIRRVDSGIDYYSYNEYHPLCKSEGTQARAKYYDRVIFKTRSVHADWCENAIGVQTMLDDDYEMAPEPPEKPWLSIFTSTNALMNLNNDIMVSPILYRILKEAVRPLPIKPTDPFAASYLFSRSKAYWAERQLQEPFTEFSQHIYHTNKLLLMDTNDRSKPFQKLNHSLSHIKLNIKKYRSRNDLLEESFISEDTDATIVEDRSHLVLDQDRHIKRQSDEKIHAMKSMMRKMISKNKF